MLKHVLQSFLKESEVISLGETFSSRNLSVVSPCEASDVCMFL